MLGSGETYGQGIQKIVLIILFLFLTIALFITWNVPSVGFESSIYNSTPPVLWIALISSMIVGISIVILSTPSSGFGRSNLWKYGFLLILLCYVIGLGLFIIRGYYMWGMINDPASHIGWTNEILQNGLTPPTLFYPITHIFLSEMSLVTTLNPVFFSKIIPLIFGVLCVGFIYIFVRVLSTNQIEPVIAGIIGCTFVYGWYLNFTPNMLANMFFPLALFLMFKYLKTNAFSWGILLYIALLLYPVFHPVPSIILGLILLTLWIPHKLHEVWNFFREKNRNVPNLHRINIKTVIPFLFLLIWSIFWYSLYSIWGYTITEVYQLVRTEETSHGITLMEQVRYAQFYGYNVVEIFLKNYADLLLLTILSVISFFLLWKTVSREQKQENIFSLYGPWALICIAIPALFLFNLPFGPLRFLFYISVLETVFVAFLVSFILIKSRENKMPFVSWVTSIVVVVFLVGLFLSGLLVLYPSPYTLTLTDQTTQSEVSGMTHFFEYRDVTIPVAGFHTAVGRFADLLLSPQERSVHHLPLYLEDKDRPPWHFGYNQFPSIASSYNGETNLIITQRDKLMYSDYFPDMAEFRMTPRDFERLNNDSGANLLYSNGGFNLLTIVPKR
jgi:hypothetical protein